MPDDLRCWIYSHLPELFVDVPRRLEPPPPGAGRSHPATRHAVDALCRALAAASPGELAFCAEDAYRPARLTIRGWAAEDARSMDRSAHPVRLDRARDP